MKPLAPDAAIELRHLRYFVAVAEEQHFTKAARRLNISQPPLSQQIRQLEEAIGVDLLARTTRHVELTAAGRVLLAAARRTLAEGGRAIDAARRAGRGEVDTLRVGFTDSAALSILPGTIRRFRRASPNVHLDLHEEATQAQVEAVRLGEVDVALVRGPLEHPLAAGLRGDVVLEEPFCVALPSGHRLARRPAVRLRQLAEVELIFFPRRLARAHYDAIIRACHVAGFSPGVAYESARYDSIVGLVAAGLGASIVPNSVRALRRNGVRYLPLSDMRQLAQIVAVYPQRGASAAADSFLRHAREEGEDRAP